MRSHLQWRQYGHAEHVVFPFKGNWFNNMYSIASHNAAYCVCTIFDLPKFGGFGHSFSALSVPEALTDC